MGPLIVAVGSGFIINMIFATTSSIYSSIRYLVSSNQKCYNKVITQLKELDLDYVIGVLRELVSECGQKLEYNSIRKALYGVNEILEQINEELNRIKEAYDYHKTKYLTSWRTFRYDLTTLKQHKNILDSRYTLLIDLLQIK